MDAAPELNRTRARRSRLADSKSNSTAQAGSCAEIDVVLFIQLFLCQAEQECKGLI